MSRLEIGIQRGSALQLYEAMWGPLCEAVLSILGSTGVILPVGDPKHGQPNAATFKTVGEEQVTFTWSEAPNSFDTKLDLTDPDSFQGIVPIVDFNGSDEEADSPDASYWSFGADGTGGNEPDFSLGVWVKPDQISATAMLFSKFDANTGGTKREWQIFLSGTNGYPTMEVWDDSVSPDAVIGRLAQTSISITTWSFLAFTKSTGVTSAAIKVYLNGVQVDDANSETGTYVAMEDTAALAQLGFRLDASGAKEFLYSGQMAGGPLGKFATDKELSADEVLRLYETGRRALAL